MNTLSFNNSTTHTSAGKIMKASTYLLLTLLILASALTLTPKAYSQAASVTFQLQDGSVKVEVTSSVDVHQFQLSITLPPGASLDTTKAALTGFMQNSIPLSTGNEYRWFNLDATPSKTGSLTVPATGLSAENRPQLIRLDLLDAQGNRIELLQTLPLTATLAPVTVTTTVTETRTATVTSTVTQPTTVTVTTTRTATITQPTTTTITSTITQPTTTTLTSTQTVTKTEARTVTQTTTLTTTRTEVSTTTAIKEVAVDATLYIVTIVILIIIIIILAILLIRRRRT
ncbi:MAG: hypothetical protein HA494_00040 [Thaumarchaeota archaeon]|nr:hypothetical protein [Nitrososphaerota archaeon]